MFKTAYLFDIDGTLADCSHRLPFLLNGPEKDWDAFFKNMLEDKPITPIVNIAKALSNDHELVFVTGRPETYRKETFEWLYRHLSPEVSPSNIHLVMRGKDDRRDDDLIKIEMLEHIKASGFNPVLAFEDRTRIVKAYRTAGLLCAQVSDGDF